LIYFYCSYNNKQKCFVSLSGNGINLADFVSHGSQKRRNICGGGDWGYILSFVYDYNTLELFVLLASGLVTITQEGLRLVVKENNISSLFKSCVRINLVVFSSILILGDFYQMSRTG
jgi:hypothetical protein